MIAFRTIPISATLAESARLEARSPQYGHPAHRERAKGTGPCRLCLTTFRVGEEDRLLFTYDPFAGIEPYPSPGPIFVHADGCEAYAGQSGFPEGLRTLPLVLEAYAAGRWMIARERAAGGEIEGVLSRLLEHAAVQYLHVRHGEAGCCIARIERVPAQSAAAVSDAA